VEPSAAPCLPQSQSVNAWAGLLAREDGCVLGLPRTASAGSKLQWTLRTLSLTVAGPRRIFTGFPVRPESRDSSAPEACIQLSNRGAFTPRASSASNRGWETPANWGLPHRITAETNPTMTIHCGARIFGYLGAGVVVIRCLFAFASGVLRLPRVRPGRQARFAGLHEAPLSLPRLALVFGAALPGGRPQSTAQTEPAPDRPSRH